MAHFGATFTQVVEQLQGMDTENTLNPSIFGDQAKIEERMEWNYATILDWTVGDVQAAFTRGRFTCHRIIHSARNASQTAPDPGQSFPGIVDQDTYRQQLNEPLGDTDTGDADYVFTGNAIAVSSVTALGDTVYADYDVDPLTIDCPSLAQLLVKMTAEVLGNGAVFGGSGDDGGISDTADAKAVAIYTQLQDLKNTTSVSSLLKLNLCDPVGDGGSSGYGAMDVCG